MANKKQNVFISYFKPFGLRQICDIMMVVSAILIIISLCIQETAMLLMTIGLAFFIVPALLSMIRAIVFLTGDVNKRSPEFKKAITIIVFMAVGIILAAVCIYLNYNPLH